MKKHGSSAGKKKFNFGFKRNRTAGDIKKRSERTAGIVDSYLKTDYPKFNIRNYGDHCIRFMQATFSPNLDKHYGMDVWLHKPVGAQNIRFLCATKMKEKPCPMCEERERLFEENPGLKKGDKLWKRAVGLFPQNRVMYWVVDR
ncbi:hypothetical protein LCGC14_2979510, partial [marine sediment metagenome]